MSDDPGFLAQLGIRLPDMVAGLAGGIVNAFVIRRADPISILGSIIVGALTANYLSGSLANYLGTGPGVGGFVVGVAGMAICQGILEAAKSWRPFQPTTRSGQDGNRPNP